MQARGSCEGVALASLDRLLGELLVLDIQESRQSRVLTVLKPFGSKSLKGKWALRAVSRRASGEKGCNKAFCQEVHIRAGLGRSGQLCCCWRGVAWREEYHNEAQEPRLQAFCDLSQQKVRKRRTFPQISYDFLMIHTIMINNVLHFGLL